MRKQAGSSRIKAAGPKKNFSGPPVVGLLALATCARAAILAAGLPAVIAAARAAACSLQLAGLAECHCTENKNERKKRDSTLHLNLLFEVKSPVHRLRIRVSLHPRSGIVCLNVRRSLNPKNPEENITGRACTHSSIRRQIGE
jgi:hypothetical protein